MSERGKMLLLPRIMKRSDNSPGKANSSGEDPHPAFKLFSFDMKPVLTDITPNSVNHHSTPTAPMDTPATEKRLKSRNIQPTAMRLLVLDFLTRNRSAVSLADLEESFDRSDRTTLYRTLKTFLEHGLVHQIHDESGTAKYALCAEECTC